MSQQNPEINSEQKVTTETLHQQTATISLEPMPETALLASYPDFEAGQVCAELNCGDPIANRFVIAHNSEKQQYYIGEMFPVAESDQPAPAMPKTYRLGGIQLLETAKPVIIGRKKLGDQNIVHPNGHMSTTHATLELTADQQLKITDTSSNATELHYLATPSETEVVEEDEPAAQNDSVEPILPTPQTESLSLADQMEQLRTNEQHPELANNLANALPVMLEAIIRDANDKTPDGSKTWQAHFEKVDGKLYLNATKRPNLNNISLDQKNSAYIRTLRVAVDERGVPLGDELQVAIEFWSPAAFSDRQVPGIQLTVGANNIQVQHTETLLDQNKFVKVIAAAPDQVARDERFANSFLQYVALNHGKVGEPLPTSHK